MHRSAAAPTRRAVLAGAVAALGTPVLAACTGGDGGPPAVPADVVAADRAALRERRLLAAYGAALLLAPQLAGRLAPLRADHAAHLAALAVPETPGPSAAASPAPAPVAAPPLPPDPPALLAALADLEGRAATAHARAAVLSGRGVGALLAALSASEASHVEALG